MSYLLGWDVSSNNASSWEPRADECFGWVKATEGKSYVNPDYDEQLRKARDHNQVVGHYHWLNDGDISAQVNWFVNNADVRPGEMIACDWEDPSNPTTAQKDQWIKTIQHEYPDNRVGLYCNRDWWLNHDTTSFAGDYLWIANYTTAPDPGIEYDWLFWQFSREPMDQNRGRFDSEADLRAWAGCGDGGTPAPGPTNGIWYSTDYLEVVGDEPPPPAKPGWSGPTVILDDPSPDPDRYVSYAQAVVRVGAVDTDDGHHYDACYILAQDYENKGDIRFYSTYSDGRYSEQWFQVNDAGHGQTFHAYRSAAGNLYVWCGENPAYRYKWQSGVKVSRSSGTKMDYKGSRPVGSHEPWVGFRDATDTKETFYLFDRTDFTDGTNRTKPVKSVTISKQTARAQQSWCLDEHRIYRISGSTNDDPPNGTKLHVVEVFDWAGKRLLELDVTKMAISTTSDEPEGLTYSGTPGSVLAGKREGSTDPAKRSYPLWTLTGLP